MLTYFDVVEHLITSSFGGPQDAEQRDIRTAVQRAYSEVTQIRDWAYYQKTGRIYLTPAVGEGTATVNQGTATTTQGMTPLAYGPPATHFVMRIADKNYPLASYVDGYEVTFAAPNGDVSYPAGTPYTLYRAIYPLPSDFRNLDEPSDEFNWWSGLYLTPDQAMKLERVGNSSGEPYHWTIIKDPAGDGWAIKLLGYPTTDETIDFTYRRTARPLRYSGHESASRAGTIARSNVSVTGASTQFASGMVGSALRVGDTTNSPGPITSITPWVSESKITAVSSATALTTDSQGTVASSTKYLITDPVDVAPHMHNVIYSAAEYWLARIRNQKPDNAFAMYQRDLRLAMEMDQLAPLSGRSKEIWHSGGWRSPLKPDRGA